MLETRSLHPTLAREVIGIRAWELQDEAVIAELRGLYSRYGVLTIAWILVGYFGFLDLGLSRASTNALAKLRAAPQADRARVLLTTLILRVRLKTPIRELFA